MNYDQYLERLELDVQRVDADFRNQTRLWERFDEYLDSINEAPGTFASIINSLRTSTVVLVHRLFDKGSVNLSKLIAEAEPHLNEIEWANEPPTIDELNRHKGEIKKLKPVLERIRVQRNKVYAHLDAEHVLNREAFASDHPLRSEDVQQAIELAQRIIQEHYRWRHGPHLEMGVVGAVNVDHFLELLRIGRKYRRQCRLPRFSAHS